MASAITHKLSEGDATSTTPPSDDEDGAPAVGEVTSHDPWKRSNVNDPALGKRERGTRRGNGVRPRRMLRQRRAPEGGRYIGNCEEPATHLSASLGTDRGCGREGSSTTPPSTNEDGAPGRPSQERVAGRRVAPKDTGAGNWRALRQSFMSWLKPQPANHRKAKQRQRPHPRKTRMGHRERQRRQAEANATAKAPA
jgi:hypothetical protein